MNETEQNAVCALIIRRIEELARMRDGMATAAAREAINDEMEFMQGIIAKINGQPLQSFLRQRPTKPTVNISAIKKIFPPATTTAPNPPLGG